MYYRIYRLKIKKSSMIIPSISHSSGYKSMVTLLMPPVPGAHLLFFFPSGPMVSLVLLWPVWLPPNLRPKRGEAQVGLGCGLIFVNMSLVSPRYFRTSASLTQWTMNHIMTVMILSTWLWLSSCMDKVAADGMLLVCHGKGSIHRTLSYGDIWGCSFSLWCGKSYCPRIRWRQTCGQTETSYHGVCI